MPIIELEHHGLNVVIERTDDGDVRLLHFGVRDGQGAWPDQEDQRRTYRLVELQATGESQYGHHGPKYLGTNPAGRLRYVRHRQTQTGQGPKLEIEQAADGLTVISHLQFIAGVGVARAWTQVVNQSSQPVGLEYVSSFCLTGITRDGQPCDWDRKTRLHVPHNAWNGEVQWRCYTPSDLGLPRVGIFTAKRLSFFHAGAWPTSQYLPMGCAQNTAADCTLFWQIEHNGSWHWEIGDVEHQQLYLRAGGPTYNECQWWKQLQPGAQFTSVPVAAGSVRGGVDEALRQLVRYRRAIRRPNPDDGALPIIFNNYMNCLGADPTQEKLLPLIDAAADVGCEYFCLDAGWYADTGWWLTVGRWEPSATRFPSGLAWLFDQVRRRGMLPRLWLEVEVVGRECDLAASLPDSWFFQRHGKRVMTQGRYQLDFRNDQVIAHVNRIVDRLIAQLGLRYLKLDYNIEPGVGTDYQSDSVGDGLLEHNRAYLAWLGALLERHPDLIVENCAAGGMRMDYATLALLSLQSSSDQTDYRKFAPISAAVFSAATPEQCAAWSYPKADDDDEAVTFNMVNVLLLRVHQAGRLDVLSPSRLDLVRRALAYYKSIRAVLPQALPCWPLGLPRLDDPWTSLGLMTSKTTYLAVWRLGSQDSTRSLPLPHLKNQPVRLRCAYPSAANGQWQWRTDAATLQVTLPQPYCARLFELTT